MASPAHTVASSQGESIEGLENGVDVDSSGTSQEGSEDGARAQPDAGKADSGLREDGLQPKDTAKKKRTSKTAKLKQSKQEARREQFLAQVAAKTVKVPTGPSQGKVEKGEEGSQHEPVGNNVAPSVGYAVEVRDESAETQATSSLLAEAVNGSSNQDLPAGKAGGFRKPLRKSKSEMTMSVTVSVTDSAPPPLPGKAGKKKGKQAGAGLGNHGSAGDGSGKGLPSLGKGRNGVHDDRGSPSLGPQGEVSGKGEEGEIGDPLEDDWEVAVEKFSKKVAKVAGPRSGSVEPEVVAEGGKGNGTAEVGNSHEAGNAGADQKGTAQPAVEYSFRPNQQEGSGEGCFAVSQRLCPPNGLRPAYTYTASSFSRPRSASERAWRPDDTLRPQTLPPALPQRTANRGLLGVPGELGLVGPWRVAQLSPVQWPAPNSSHPQPACCPICAEELDVTDSSFVPCSCGFRLCLFCHHRIAADDGRCPGCRRAYSPDAASRSSKPPSTWLRL